MKTNLFKTAALLILTSMFVACNDRPSSTEGDTKHGLTPVSTTTLAKGFLQNGTESLVQKNFVITSESEWINLKATMEKYHADSLSKTEVDFNKNQIIAVFDIESTHPYHDWSVNIEAITEYEQEIEVIVKSELKISYPPHNKYNTLSYHLMIMPRSEKPVRFKTVPLPCTTPKSSQGVSVWECNPDPRISIFLTFDSSQNIITTKICPQNTDGLTFGYTFRDGMQFVVQNDSLYTKDQPTEAAYHRTLLSQDRMQLDFLLPIGAVPPCCQTSYLFTCKEK